MKVGDKVRDKAAASQGEIVKVESEPDGPVPGRYTVKFDDGFVVENFPGYLLELAR